MNQLPTNTVQSGAEPSTAGYLERTLVTLPFGIGARLAPLFIGNGLKQRAARGSVWTIAGYGAGQVLRLASNLILTRLLFPEAFGLMALVGAFMQGLAMFSDVGIGPAIVQSKRGDEPAFFNTAWTIQVLRGVLLTLVAAAIAKPVAQFYNEPILLRLMPVAGLSALIAGFTPTKAITARRHLSLGRLVTVELVSQVTGMIFVIALAWMYKSVWALVLGGLVSSAMGVLLVQIALPGPMNRFHWDPTASRVLFQFGRWIFLSTVFTFFARQSDKLILGSLLSVSWLGVYSIAVTLMMTVEGFLGQLATRVGYVVYARLNHLSADDFVVRTDRIRRHALILWALICGCFVIASDPLIRLVWDSRYSDAGWMATLLGLALWPSGLMTLSSMALTARGEPRFQAYGQILAAAGIVLSVPTAYWFSGEVAAVAAVSVGYWAAYTLTLLAGLRHKVIRLKSDLHAHSVFCVVIVLGTILKEI